MRPHIVRQGPPLAAIAAGGARAMAVALCALVVVAGPAGAAPPPVFFPSGASAYLIEVDGARRWSQAADLELPPASLTKLMTALLVLERVPGLDSVATASARVATETGTRIGLRPGERLRLKDLLAAALVGSANDACLALAEHVAGTESAFVVLMNRRAAELGLGHTHFANACGHDEPRHRSSAADLARLANLALRQPVLAELVQLERLRITSLDGRGWNLSNSNLLLGRYAGTDGVKTGYTPAAGRCLIARARRNRTTVLLVVLGAANRWWEAEAALDRAFDAASSPNAAR